VRRAHSARVYDYWLGGKDNFAADREAAEEAIAASPGIVEDVRANRAFLARAVRFLARERGVWQRLRSAPISNPSTSTRPTARSSTRATSSSVLSTRAFPLRAPMR